MAQVFDKKDVLGLFCSLRQAERSVHYALSCPKQWPEFVAYYDDARTIRIVDQIRLLKEAGATYNKIPRRHSSSQNAMVSILRSALQALTNQFKSHWSFSAEEISLFSATLRRLLELLSSPGQPSLDELMALREDCYECCALIERRLVGLPEIKRALSIEHFYQSEHVSHVTFDEMGLLARAPAQSVPHRLGKGITGRGGRG
jgi:hypothetical protein